MNYNMFDVSIIIVCMNNLSNLIPCLDSIKKYTSLSYETIVVAYMFSPENLLYIKQNYPWIKIIESKEIRGFSENNNLAIKIAKGKYCFILNDDTVFPMPVVDLLFDSIEKLPESVVCISPATYFKNDEIQSCGRPRHSFLTYSLFLMGLWKEQKIKSKYTYQTGVFQTYDIVGAAFLFRTEVLKELGMFDEQYFFCPEDIALSAKANQMGYLFFVDSNVKIYHIENATANLVKTATSPAAVKGELNYYSNSSFFKYFLLSILVILRSFAKLCVNLYFYILTHNQKFYIDVRAHRNIIYCVFADKSPKDIFVKYYNQIKE